MLTVRLLAIELAPGLEPFNRRARNRRRQRVGEAVLHDRQPLSSNATVRSRFAVARFAAW